MKIWLFPCGLVKVGMLELVLGYNFKYKESHVVCVRKRHFDFIHSSNWLGHLFYP